MKIMKNFDIVENKRVFIIIPVVLLAVVIIFTLVFGAVVSIEFTGGTIMTYSYTGELDFGQIKSEIEDLDFGSVNITGGSAFNTDIELINVAFSSNEGLSAEQLSSVTARLAAAFPENGIMLENSQNVSPSTGLRFFLKCLVAFVFAFILFIIYIALRFKKLGGWSTGVFALLALSVDVMVVVSVFIFFRLPIDAIFMAVVLAIMGYSINNTIILYDRIRENKTLFAGKRSPRQLVNLSVRQSLTRTINTTVTTAAALLVLSIVAMIYDVNTILNFAFPMLIGLISGVYTTLCLSGTFWVMWQEFKAKPESPESRNAPGKTILNAVGILGVIFAGINSILIFLGLTNIELLDDVVPNVMGLPWHFYYLFAFAVVGYSIFASIMAIIHSAVLEKANFLKTLGIISIFLAVVFGIMDVIEIGLRAAVLLPINLALPILYIHGALKNFKAFGRR
ncbi:MAG: protein translocase subunit SecF [Oscillospiraceae bacterium]|jgi:preprotein translocase SecF subunit|nr:protein translocase subunit SecF [Oscillospiraceae bacterium]